MRKLANHLVLVVFIVTLFSMLLGCAKEQEKEEVTAAANDEVSEAVETEKVYTGRIGISTPTATHGYLGRVNWWVQRAVADWKEKYPDLEFLIVAADNVQKQAADIEDLMVKDIDGIVIFPFDSSLTTLVEKVYNQGIYTVIVSRGLTEPHYDVYLSNDDASYAGEGIKWIAEELNYKGKLALIEGIPCVTNSVRVDTIKNFCAKHKGLEILDSQPGFWNQQKAHDVMENYLQRFPEIDAVFTVDDDMLKGALQAYRESGRDDIKIFLGGAADKEILQMIIDGNELVRANVTYPPNVIATGISLAVLGVNEQRFEGFYQYKLPKRIILNAELITRENADQYFVPEEMTDIIK